MNNIARFVFASLFVTATASADPPPPPQHGPPPEAFTACESKAKGDTCSVTISDRTIDGTCDGAPPGVNDSRLACHPSCPSAPSSSPPSFSR